MVAGEKTIKVKFTGETRDLDRASRKAEKDIAGFGTRVTKGLQSVADSLPDMLSGVIGSLPPQGQAIALVLTAGLAVALSAAIGAALSTAVLFVAGGGVLAAGIASAVRDPKVAKAFAGLKKEAASVFTDLGEPFKAPLIRAATFFTQTLKSLKPQIQELGKTIAPVIDMLGPALGEFFKTMMPGIQKAVAASVPLFKTLAEHLPFIASAIGQFFTTISKNGDGANKFFSDFLLLVEGTIIVLGKVIGWLTNLYGHIHDFVANSKTEFLQFKIYVLGVFQSLLNAAVTAFGWIPGLGPKLKTAQAQFQQLRINANNELDKIRDKKVMVTVWSNVGSIVANVAYQLSTLKGIKVPGKATGGAVAANRSYMVGERGPELLTMGSTGGFITPNHQLAGTDGATPMIQVFIGQEELEQIAYRVVQQTNKQLKRDARARGAGR